MAVCETCLPESPALSWRRSLCLGPRGVVERLAAVLRPIAALVAEPAGHASSLRRVAPELSVVLTTGGYVMELGVANLDIRDFEDKSAVAAR